MRDAYILNNGLWNIHSAILVCGPVVLLVISGVLLLRDSSNEKVTELTWWGLGLLVGAVAALLLGVYILLPITLLIAAGYLYLWAKAAAKIFKKKAKAPPSP